jgi:hypothetical protein
MHFQMSAQLDSSRCTPFGTLHNDALLDTNNVRNEESYNGHDHAISKSGTLK